MGDTLTRLKADRGINVAFVLAIEGYPFLITDNDTSAAVTAWSAHADWSKALPGLRIESGYEQSIEPLGTKLGVGNLSLSVEPEGDDTFGTDVFDRGSGNETRLDADIDNDDTTVTVVDTSNFASSGEAYIGVECFAYSGTTSTTFTGVTRGKYSPFAIDGGSRFGRQHRLPEVDGTVEIKPLVSSNPRVWRGKWVGLWLHRINPGGTWDVLAEAQLVYAGLIESVEDGERGETVIQTVDAKAKIKETVLFHEQYTGRVREGAYLRAPHTFTYYQRYESGGSVTENDADDLVIVESGASGANQIDEGWYTVTEIADFLQEWLASEASGGNVDGTMSFDPEHASNSGTRFRTTWEVPSGASDVRFRLGAPKNALALCGFTGNADYYENTIGTGVRDSDETPFRIMAGEHSSIIVSGTDVIEIERTEGTWINQREWLPAKFTAHADSISGAGLGDWGFLLIGDEMIMFGRNLGGGVFQDVLINDDFLALSHGLSDDTAISRRIDEDGDVVAKQFVLLAGAFDDLVTALLASTGTDGYNESTHDSLGFGLCAAIPWDLLGSNWENAIASLPEASGTMFVRIEKPINLWGLIHSAFQLRSAHIVWRNQGLRVASWSSPVADLAEHTLTESNKALPADLRGKDRAITKQSNRTQVTRILIEHDYDLQGQAQSRSKIIDAAAETDHGVQSLKTIRARSDYGAEAVGLGQDTIVNLIADLGSRTLPLISRPLAVMRRTIDSTLAEDVAPGDLVVVTDNHARDPSDGTRGLSGKPGIVLSHSYSWEDGVGEVEIGFYDTDRKTIWSPSATFTGDNYSADTPSAGQSTITNTTHEYSTSSEDADAANFEANDEVMVIEVDPSDPASATSWNVTIGSQSGDDLVLDDNLAGIGTTSSDIYRVVSRAYSTAQATQRTDAYQADDADLQIQDLAQPYEYAALAGNTAGFDALDLSDLPERHATDYWGDGVALSVGGVGDALARMTASLMNYKTALMGPWLSDTALSASGAAVAFRLVMMRPVFLGPAEYGILSRALEVAPFFRGDGSNDRTLRVTLSLHRPSGSSLAAITFTGPKSQAEFSRTSATWTTPSTEDLEIPHAVNANGIGWLTIEVEDGIETYGLGVCRAKELTL